MLLARRCIQTVVTKKVHRTDVRLLSKSTSKQSSSLMRISDEVSLALNRGQPVVALESTIITHGMPFPTNYTVALEVESVVRHHGAVPATVAILDGKLCVGLSRDEIEKLASPSTSVHKASKRDLSAVITQKLNGGTTVSATMFAAHKAGIDVFVTGGVGGVHRDVESSMDISADLVELGRTPVAVVCAGVKSILDIRRTLEFLETQGVPVVVVGDSSEFPAFFSRKSGFRAPHIARVPADAARLIANHRALDLSTGILLAVPVPPEFSLDPDIMNHAITAAIEEARLLNVIGKDVTPFLLERVNKLLDGKSLEANVALVKNNAAVGSQIACRLAEMNQHSGRQTSRRVSRADTVDSDRCLEQKASNTHHISDHRVAVVGGINFDLSVAFANQVVFKELDAKTFPGRIRQSFGGVGRNIADCLSRMGTIPMFVSALGDDIAGQAFYPQHMHMDLRSVKSLSGVATASYCCILNSDGQLLSGVGDSECHKKMVPDFVANFCSEIVASELVVVDGNLPPESLSYVCKLCHENNVPVWFEPTDVSHVWKLSTDDSWGRIDFVSPNLAELRQLRATIERKHQPVVNSISPDDMPLDEVVDECVVHAKALLEHIPNLIITIGRHGVIVARRADINDSFLLERPATKLRDASRLSIVHYPAAKLHGARPVSVSGAGDCLAAGLIHGTLNGYAPDVAVRTGLLAASMSLHSYSAVPQTISPQSMSQESVLQAISVRCNVILS